MLYDPSRLLVIAGPCSLESVDVCQAIASELRGIANRIPEVQFVFKGSFDKANRTSIEGRRGLGLEEGLGLLAGIRDTHGFPILTDVHLPQQAPAVAEVCDVLQIPAFLCRQTDLLTACARTRKPVNVKKGQFLSPQEMKYVVGKLAASNAGEIWQTERGTTFGYQNLVVDMRAFPLLRQWGQPVIFDATHSVQLPGAGDGKSSGQREFVPTLARSALAAGADGLFIETHPKPEEAWSDGPNMVPLAELEALLSSCRDVWQAVR